MNKELIKDKIRVTYINKLNEEKYKDFSSLKQAVKCIKINYCFEFDVYTIFLKVNNECHEITTEEEELF